MSKQKVDKNEKSIEQVIVDNGQVFQNGEKEKLAVELIIANKALAFQIQEREKRAEELMTANIELAFQNEEKEKRAAELVVANKELVFQTEEKGKRSAELLIANIELAFQNAEKEKRAAEQLITINDLKKAEAKIKKVNRLYAFSNEVNQHIVRIRDGAALFESFFRIALELGKFKMAWIGMFNKEERKITLAGHGGIAEDDIRLFTDIPYQTGDPQDYVLRTGTYYACNDMAKDFKFEKWKSFVEKHEIHSCIVLPIRQSGKIIGTFNLYAGEPDFFDREEIELLEEVSKDISFALDILEKAKKQKFAEELIFKNENRFRALIEKSADMKTLSTREGEMIYCSPSITKVLGYTSGEFVHTSAFNRIHPDDILRYTEKRNEILQTAGKSFTIQARFLHKDGHWVWCEGSVTNMLAEPGINALVSNFRDISEMKKTEMQQEFDNNNLNALINNTADLMWSVNKDFNLITSNQPFDEMGRALFGKPIAKGSSVLSETYSPSMKSHIKRLYERAFAGETFTEISYSGFPAELWTEVSYNPIRKGKNVIGTACHSRDITNIKRAEKQLSKSEATLKEAQAIAQTGNWEIDLVHNIHTWSDELYHILGITKNSEQASTELFLSFIHGDDRDAIKENVKQSLVSLECSNLSFRFVRKDGAPRYGCIERKIEFDKGNKPIRLYGIMQDITDRKIAEDEREKMIQEMKQHEEEIRMLNEGLEKSVGERTEELMLANKELKQFSYIASHDLQEPLRTVSNYLQVFKEDYAVKLDDKAHQYLNSINNSISRMSLLIKSLLKYSRLGHGKRLMSLDSKKIIEDVIMDLQGIVRASGAIITVSEMPHLNIYETEIRQLFQNLIINAIKFQKKGTRPEIQISSEKINGAWKFSVSDNGIGIDPAHFEKIFDIFQRLETSEKYEGSGIGLANCKKIVQLHQGEIWVESIPGQGATFYFTLPNLVQ